MSLTKERLGTQRWDEVERTFARTSRLEIPTEQLTSLRPSTNSSTRTRKDIRVNSKLSFLALSNRLITLLSPPRLYQAHLQVIMASPSSLNITDATIDQLQQALCNRAITSVELVARFLHRIGKYDYRGPSLNSICILNLNVFKEAQSSDDYRASGRPPRPLEGIPFTVKDSFQVQGLTVAAGSPAFVDLVASSDAAVVESLRTAGAVLIGKTNMPPMADGGSQRGAYGRSTSP